jgi:hypothetical protein
MVPPPKYLKKKKKKKTGKPVPEKVPMDEVNNYIQLPDPSLSKVLESYIKPASVISL